MIYIKKMLKINILKINTFFNSLIFDLSFKFYSKKNIINNYKNNFYY